MNNSRISYKVDFVTCVPDAYIQESMYTTKTLRIQEEEIVLTITDRGI